MNQANSSDNDYWIKKPQEYINVHKQITVETQSNSFACVDFYKQARDQFLSLRFEDYPDIVISSFSLSCMIPNNTKKAPLVYAILEKIQYTTVDNNAVSIKIITEKDILSNFKYIYDLVSVIGRWRSTLVKINDIPIRIPTEFGYFTDYLYEKYRDFPWSHYSNIQYLPKKNRTKRNNEIITLHLSKTDYYASLDAVIRKYIELYGNNKEVQCFSIASTDKVVMIENSLIINFRLIPKYWAAPENEKDWEYPYIIIQELTHNDLFRFNYTAFKKCFSFDSIGLDFYYFHGKHYYIKEIDNYNIVNSSLPELNLDQRLDDYCGETHHFVLLRMENAEGKIVYGIGDTKNKVHSFVMKLCKELEEKNSNSLRINGASCLPFVENQGFIKAFLSWEGKKKRWRLENKFSYYYEDRDIKNDLYIPDILEELIKAATDGKFDKCEFGFYAKPLNRWKSEEFVYNITKKIYKDYQVLYQYKPYYLSTDFGNMSYDIYICGLKTAIEYQGKQHFEPVEYFGGLENFQKQQERDKLKAERSKQNGVKLIYINYWEDITVELIRVCF